MNILVITDLYPIKDDEKYTPKTIKHFVDGWKDLGHSVKIIKPNFLFNSFIRKKPFYKSGIYDEVENINYFLPFLGNIKNKIRGKYNLGKYNGGKYNGGKYNPDIVFAHMPSGVIFANKLEYPFIAAVHVSDLEVLTNPIYSFYFKSELKKAYKNAKKIACRSEVIKNKFLKLFPEYEKKTFVCYSGINSEIIKREWRPNNPPRVFVCANLIKRKNVDKVVRACENLPVELVIAGDGAELKNLKKISSKPKFLGHIKNSEVIAQMRKSDIFALPSKNETFGMVYLEAMASGCITICSENEAIAGILKNNENGYFWSDDIIEKILNSNTQDKILDNCYNTILNYTQQKACENYLKNAMN